ncbi:MAG TPA: efflux RND transporter periplasmic adaptor subunit [Candidatus Aminicenantes bacterium]|nr:efflux RND transporter periplasmic adaptor subunit [Candidatus Aminicenantes bacterium]
MDWNKIRSKLWTRKSRPFTLLALLVLAYLGWQIVARIVEGGSSGGPQGAAVAVEIAAIERGGIRDVGSFSGTLIPKSYFTIVPKISGRVKELYVDIGDQLARGRLVAILEDEEYQQQVIQAEADLGVAKANLQEAASTRDLAQKEYERAKALHARGILSDSELDAAASAFGTRDARQKVALAQVANQEAALETARVRLSYTRIRASWEAEDEIRYVGERFVNPGAMISSTTPILSVIDLEPITAVIHVTEKDYFRVEPAQPVALTSGAFPGREFQGRVARIAPLLKETSREARIEVDTDNPGGILKPGMFVNARIEFTAREEATIIPYSAVATRGGLQGIFMADLEAKKAAFQPVTLGIIEGERAEIVEPAGLSGFVVTLGHHLLEDGTSLILPDDAPAAASPASKDAPGDER